MIVEQRLHLYLCSLQATSLDLCTAIQVILAGTMQPIFAVSTAAKASCKEKTEVELKFLLQFAFMSFIGQYQPMSRTQYLLFSTAVLGA